MISGVIVLTDFALISVSLIDCQICDRTYEWKFRQKPVFPIVPGVDCVGTVTSCGALVTMNGFAPGDRVASFQLHIITTTMK